MSGRDNKFPVTSGAMGRLMSKIKRTVSDADEKRDPLHRGYSRVEAADGSLSNSSTSTSLDTVVVESAKDSSLLSGGVKTASDQNTRVPFSPILETEDTDISALNNLSITSNSSTLKTFENPLLSNLKKSATNISRPSLKGSKVSFEQPDNDSDDSFEDRRGHFQQKKSLSSSATDRKGILKDLRNSRLDADRRAFQSKKHVSLDIKNSKILEKILAGSSSEEEFTTNRKHFQSRKHQSLDARIINLNKTRPRSNSCVAIDDEFDEKGNLIHEKIHDFSKPIIIDFKDLEVSDEEEEEDEEEEVDKEDFEAARSNFQKQKTISVESRKSIRFFEMDDINGRKGDNIRQAVPFVRQITQDGKPKLEVYRPTTNPIYYYTQILAALSVSLGSLVVGFSSGYTSPALPSMNSTVNNEYFNVSQDQGSNIGSFMPLGGLIGGIAGGPLIDILGRKTTILATSIPFIVSWLFIAMARSVYMVYIGRILAGLCIGVASLSLPVYLGETVQPEVRGTLGLLPTAFGNTGILLVFAIGSFVNWSTLAYIGGCLPIPFLLLMLIIPETPRWYVSKGRDEEARKALQWLRGKQADVDPELKGIIKTHTDAERQSSSNGLRQLLRRSNLKPLAISLGLMFFQQFSGINAVIFYAQDIFNGGKTEAEIERIKAEGGDSSTIVLGVVNFIATFVATVLIDRLGRKVLLYISSAGMIASMAILGVFFYKKDFGDVSDLGWMPLSCLVVYVLSFSLGFGPVPWLMMGEILPAKIRGPAASVATGFNWSCTFVVTKGFTAIVGLAKWYGAFWIFTGVCILGLVFVILKVPETQGKSLEDIERKMMGRIRRMSSVANIRPLSFNL